MNIKKHYQRLTALISASLMPSISDHVIAAENDNAIQPEQPFAADLLNHSIPIELAQHRSHRSHQSHSSHRSSSGGGTSSAPRTVPTPAPTPNSDPLGQAARPDGSIPQEKPRQSSGDMLAEVIKRVQLALTFSGHYKGAVDGLMGPQTRKAIEQYRQDHDLKTGEYIDAELLNSLGIKSP